MKDMSEFLTKLQSMKVEANLPIPRPHSLGKGDPEIDAQIALMLAQLRVGDSLFEALDSNTPHKINKAYTLNRIQYRGQKQGMRFVSRAVEGGMRIWRVK